MFFLKKKKTNAFWSSKSHLKVLELFKSFYYTKRLSPIKFKMMYSPNFRKNRMGEFVPTTVYCSEKTRKNGKLTTLSRRTIDFRP